MRLITLSLFAFLLAVSAFGQTADTSGSGSTVLIRAAVRTPNGDTQPRFCNGVVLSQQRRWVLTAASCLDLDRGARIGVYSPRPAPPSESNQAGWNVEVALMAVIHPERAINPLQEVGSSYDLALIQMACGIPSTPAQMIDSDHLVSRRGPIWTPGVSVAAVAVPYQGRHFPYRSSGPLSGNAEFQHNQGGATWAFPQGLSQLSGNAREAAPGMPLYVDGTVVGILSGSAGSGVADFGLPNPSNFPNRLVPSSRYPSFTDITNDVTWEWITRTMRESLDLFELCGSLRR